jgi:hypothetical protein
MESRLTVTQDLRTNMSYRIVELESMSRHTYRSGSSADPKFGEPHSLVTC